MEFPVILENKNVGEDLQDYLITGISFGVEKHIYTGDYLIRQKLITTQAAKQIFKETKSGPLTSAPDPML